MSVFSNKWPRVRCALVGLMMIVASACDDATTAGAASGVDAAGEASSGDQPDPLVVALTADDGVVLEADYYPATSENRGAVVLLHQIPPTYDRTSWPRRVIDALAAADRHVLNLDRRGAGASDGEARDAYEGEAGRLDVEAAIAYLVDPERSPAVSPDAIVLIAASNGTTPTLDYTLGRTRLDSPDPVALVWLSPGTYTERQHEIAEHRDALDALPILWVRPDSEPWSRDFEAGAPAAWRFVEIDGGLHGTANFDGGALEAVMLPEITGWLDEHAP